MKTINAFLSLLILFQFLTVRTLSQEAFSASAGSTVDTNGSVNFTIGQVFFSTNVGIGGVVQEGIQLPFEFAVLGEREFNVTSLHCVLYPNPSRDFVILVIDRPISGLKYRLCTIEGKLLSSGKIMDMKSKIFLPDCANQLLLLSIYRNSNFLGVYRIIKNDKP